MRNLSDFDKELIKRRENHICLLKQERKMLIKRLLSVRKEINSLRKWNRELKNREV